MKKLLSLLLVFAMLLPMLSLNAHAAENNSSEYDILMNMACDVFPEYAGLINGNYAEFASVSRDSSDASEYIVENVTRKISDNESLTLSIFKNGNVIVINNMNSSVIDLINTNTTTNSISTVGVNGTASFRVALKENYGLGYDLYFELSNVNFTIYYTGSDYFSNYGTVTANTFHRYTLYNPTTTNFEYLLYVSETSSPHYLQLYFSNDSLIAKAA